MSSILLERRCDTGSTVFCTMYAKQDWHQRGSVIHADAVMDRIVSNTLWIDLRPTQSPRGEKCHQP